MKRFALGIIVALAIALIGGTAQTGAAPSAPKPQPGQGIGGQVASVDGTTITVTTPKGTATIATTSATTFEIKHADIRALLKTQYEKDPKLDLWLPATFSERYERTRDVKELVECEAKYSNYRRFETAWRIK